MPTVYETAGKKMSELSKTNENRIYEKSELLSTQRL